MGSIGYYFSLPFLYLVSALPFPFLYLFSDFFFWLIYYVIGYRKKVVIQNLKNSFPEKSETELLRLRIKFYRYLCDLLLETCKTLTISKKEMLKHCYMNEQAVRLFERYYNEKKNVIIVLGHFGNWEWGGNAFSLQCKHQLYVIYHPLQNKYFDRLIYNMRTRFGTKLIERKNTFQEMIRIKNNSSSHQSNKPEISATAFISDQTPSPENAYWTTFMNQDTPVFKGTEIIAKKLNYPIVYVNIHRISRGKYELSAETICENPTSTSDGEISELHTKKLEAEIRKNPETWLWSHKRWKHKRKQK